jgi:hypothetical protein
MPKANFGGGLSGAASGASAGSAIGSIIPGVGTAIGGAVGGLAGGLAGLFGSKKKKKKRKQISTFDKRQQALNEQQYESLLGKGPLADLYNYDPQGANDVFEQTRSRPALREWQEKTIPGITGAFRKEGLQNSSYVGDALAKSGRDVQENLNALRTKYLYGEQENARSAKRNAVENLQNRSTFAYDNSSTEKPFDISSFLDTITPEGVEKFKGMFTTK